MSVISLNISITSFCEIVTNADVPSCEIEGSSIKIIGVAAGFASLMCLTCHNAFIVSVLMMISFKVSS